MADKVSPEIRSHTMRQVKSKNTSSEIRVRKALHAAGYRFRLHKKDLPGKPDIVLPKYRVAVLVQGCLWHGHQCKRFRWPVANADYWRAKIGRNMARDAVNLKTLKNQLWHVKVIWDCQLKEGIADLLENLERLRAWFERWGPFYQLPRDMRLPRLPSGLPQVTHREIKAYIEEGRM